MSKRMSRREMRQAGLLKPKPAVDREDEPKNSVPDAEQSPDAQSAHSSGTPVDEGGQEPEVAPDTDFEDAAPEAENPREADERRAVEGGDADDTSGFDSLTDDATQQHDTLGGYEKTDEQESAEIPERTSVFDRFSAVEKDKDVEAGSDLGEQTPDASSAGWAESANDDTDSDVQGTDQEASETVAATGVFAGKSTDVSDDASDQTEVHDRADSDIAEASTAQDVSESDHDDTPNHDDEDFAGALRAKLKSQPPIQDSEREEKEEVEYEDAPTSKWKTILLFLVLIVVGFGVGIVLGSLLFSGGGSSASALLSTYYPGAL